MPHPHSKAKQRGSYFLLFRVPRSYRLFMSGPLDGGVRHPAASKTDVHLSARSFLQRSTRKSTTAQTPPTRRPGRSGQQIARPQPLRLVGEPALCIFRRCSPRHRLLLPCLCCQPQRPGPPDPLPRDSTSLRPLEIQVRAGAAPRGRQRPACCGEPCKTTVLLRNFSSRRWGNRVNSSRFQHKGFVVSSMAMLLEA